MKTLLVDPKTAGISGDKLLASLINLTGSPEILEPLAGALRELPNCMAFSYRVDLVNCGGISAQRLHIELQEKRFSSRDELESVARDLVVKLNLSHRAGMLVGSVLSDLALAQAHIHGGSFRHHEVASLDTLFDVLGSALILDKKDFLDAMVYTLPPALGGGSIRMDGIEMSGPAPATLEILCNHGMAYSLQPVNRELTTPTGAALLANLTDLVVDFYPSMKPVALGYGAGNGELAGVPNVLRIMQGENFRATRESIVLLETNLDDLPGEVIGYTTQKLLKEGAVDVFVTNALGKKNRPVSVISVIANHSTYDRLLRILMEETGTLGVRVQEVPRIVADRTREPHSFSVLGRTFEVLVKTSSIDGKVISIKPEYEDLKKIAENLNIPLNQVIDEVKRKLPQSPRFNEP